MEIGTLLYSIIDGIGKKKIQTDITSDIGLSRGYLQLIINEFERRSGIMYDESVGSLCEALLHFMLTISTLPSSRKGQVNNVYLDIVIPNFYTLKTTPEKAIIIQIIKSIKQMDKNELSNISQIQPYHENIWIVSKNPISVSYINYVVRGERKTTYNIGKKDFSEIIWDAQKFLERTGDKSMRFLSNS